MALKPPDFELEAVSISIIYHKIRINCQYKPPGFFI
jgi:hypothetical protein